MLDYLRLAVGTLLVLAPGRLIARALGQRSSSATLAWAAAAVFVAWAVVFLVHGTVWLAVGVLGAIAAVAAAAGFRRTAGFRLSPGGHGIALGIGVVVGLL